MQTPDKSRAISEVLLATARRHGTATDAALEEIAERAYDAGFQAAEEQARGDRERARRSHELQLNEIAKLRAEIERLRR